MTSETAHARIKKAHDMVAELCRGDRKWIMSIPAKPDRDPDLIISDGLNAGDAAIEELAEVRRNLANPKGPQWHDAGDMSACNTATGVLLRETDCGRAVVTFIRDEHWDPTTCELVYIGPDRDREFELVMSVLRDLGAR